MRDSCPRVPLHAALAAAVFFAFSTGATAQFVCDVDPWSQTANSGFGAGAGEIRGFAVTPQNVPDECLVDGISYLNGVIINATQQGGSSTFPIDSVEINESTFNGPPGSNVLTFGAGGNIINVPPFPGFVQGRLPTEPTTWAWDLDDDGNLDSYAAPTAYADGDATPGQFFAFSTNGGMVPCHTGLQGSPIDEPCVNGNPNFRSMGIGVETAAGFARVDGIGQGQQDFRTNNPDAAVNDTIEFIWDFGDGVQQPEVIDLVTLFDEPGTQICSFSNVPPRSTRNCLLTPAQIQQFLEGKLEVEFDENDDIVRFEIVPANMFIFADGFESGDTTSWSNTVP